MNTEQRRLQEIQEQNIPWKKWGPYLSERQWGTVREDYSHDGQAWDYFSHDQARSRAYRWGEDGLGGISDDHQLLCFAIALWNGQDPILKERLFGLTGTEGNHGEDVKEYYFYLDNIPTHAYMKFLYKYPQHSFPYSHLVTENAHRGREGMEFELLDTGIFSENRYFDVCVEYAKASPEDILIKITVDNRGSEEATLHVLPTLWFRNTWSWKGGVEKPKLEQVSSTNDFRKIVAYHPQLGDYCLYSQGNTCVLFTDNETNLDRLFHVPNEGEYVKDGINNYVVNRQKEAVNPHKIGTKAAPHYFMDLVGGSRKVIQLRLAKNRDIAQPFGEEFERIFNTRQREANEFYDQLAPQSLTVEQRAIQRQAFAGLLWNKQYYSYNVAQWLKGDETMPYPAPERELIRNGQWIHLDSNDIISMPDKWEYPWFAAWDLAFHCIPLALIDPDLAKHQLDLMTREWYMHPNGQIPAYEWNFNDVNPPVQAWATWRVYKIEKKYSGKGDRIFLERVFQKLLLNFTWWVNRKDTEGKNVFEGGFLGLDNIGVFDRSAQLPTGGHLEQADSTSWMAMYCLNMLAIALELARENPVYEDMATKFFEHFLYIADALNHIGPDKTQLWDNEEGFFFDVLNLPNGERIPLKIRSMVGLIPLFAITTLEPDLLEQFPRFKARLEWFIRHRPDLKRNVACMETSGEKARRMLALCYATRDRLVPEDKLRRILNQLLDENEFLSPYGIRSLSRYHQDHPYSFWVGDEEYRVSYEPAESTSALFGGNSNWRGPIWLPLNFLIIEALQQFHHYLGDQFQVECPTASGQWMNLWQVSQDLSQRLLRLFLNDPSGCRPVFGGNNKFQYDPQWHNSLLFYEYFHGDNGAGIGASHQTGWTGLIAKLIQQIGEYRG
ncbi:glucosidase [Spirulina subsalsa FACHB-351]|uniref:Glucosidase n=1 Tax=Spirulina subsalsa FACHB-351 TaxID=234711 RepID=A0ABT3L577_9CYAN|nr:glucosidase [Spirulina subsalsa]MCW6036651.1 glucosidase [Spirulina subsalsa FACHB-351]